MKQALPEIAADCKSSLESTTRFPTTVLAAAVYLHFDENSERTVRSRELPAWNDSAMCKNHTKRSHTNPTETAIKEFGKGFTAATDPIGNGNAPQGNPITRPPHDTPPANEVTPGGGGGAATEGTAPYSTSESTVPSSTSRASDDCSDSWDIRNLESRLQKAAPRTYSILVSVEWDVTRLSESEFSQLVGVFYEEVGPRMERWLRDRGIADAEDVVHNIFVTILRSNARGRRRAKDFLMWLRRCESRCKSELGRQIRYAKRETSLLDENAELLGVEDRDLELSERGQELQEALNRLPDSHRKVLVLHHLEGWSLKDVAVICGKRVQAIKSLLFRARVEARKALRQIRNISTEPRNLSLSQRGIHIKPTSPRP